MKRKIIRRGRISLDDWRLGAVDAIPEIKKLVRREIEAVLRMIWVGDTLDPCITVNLAWAYGEAVKNPLALDVCLNLDGLADCVVLRFDFAEIARHSVEDALHPERKADLKAALHKLADRL